MVEVIGSSPTAPTSKATAALKSAAVVLFVRSELRVVLILYCRV